MTKKLTVMFTILTSMMISSAAFSLTKDEASRMADAGMCSYGADREIHYISNLESQVTLIS